VIQFDPRTVSEQHDIPQVEKLNAAVEGALIRTFGSNSIDYMRYKDAANIDNGPHNYAYEVPIEKVRETLTRSKSSSIALLEQAIESLQEQLEEAEPKAVEPKLSTPTKTFSRKIFVVHGHEDAPRETVARFLGNAEFNPIILHEQASGGRTIIEKIEAHGDVGFAVVLLTPDDEGCKKGESPKPRARQNVVLELGYFIGRLGRNRVCALKVGENLELPSDFGGVAYVPFDSGGGWRQTLLRELEAAGFDVDWKKAMGQR
jgi:predicted nucleotide-binding protein